MLNYIVEAILFYGYKVSQTKAIHVYHLQFVDNTMILGEKSRENVRALKSNLILLEVISWGLNVYES